MVAHKGRVAATMLGVGAVFDMLGGDHPAAPEWMQRAGLESILGLHLEGDTLHLDPCIPKAWPGFTLSLRHGSARYDIQVENPDGAGRGIAFASVDESVIAARPLRLTLTKGNALHRLLVRLG